MSSALGATLPLPKNPQPSEQLGATLTWAYPVLLGPPLSEGTPPWGRVTQ